MPENDNLLETLGVNLPYSIEAEQAVLGAAIIDPKAIFDVTPVLQPDYFFSKINGEIYRTMILLSASGKPIDFVTLLNEVNKSGIFQSEQEAKVYLFDISQTVPTVSNVVSYASIVADKYMQRSLLFAAKEIIEATSDNTENADTLIDFAEQKIYAIRKGKNRREMVKIKDAVMEEIEYLHKIDGPDREKYAGLKTGFKYIDLMLSGLNRTDLVILAARPSVGKTSFALNVATNIVKQRSDRSVAVFSLEMSNRQLAERILSSEAGVSMETFKSPPIEDHDWRTIIKSSGTLNPMKLYLDDTSMITINDIKGKCRRIEDLGLIIVDYLQLMSSDRRTDNRVQEITELTRNFKIMAKELDVPILLLSQLSRESEKAKRRPILSDLRDSGSIEQDADIVAFLHRNLPDENPEFEYECIVAKNRHGRIGRIPLQFDAQYTRFLSVEYSREDYE